VTLRPRSKLERLLDRLESVGEVPARPKNGIVAQLSLYYLLSGEASASGAAQAVKQLLAGSDGGSLVELERSVVEALCPPARVDDVLSALRAVGQAAREGLVAACARDVDEARRRLRDLPRMPAEQADFLLLASGLVSTVAPGPSALRVAVRIGYPGSSYAAVARSLDAEVPEGDVTEVAWRAHHVLKLHGQRVCKDAAPLCASCGVRDGCAFRGEGDDPASRFLPSGT
jgi:endonuclease III